MALTLYYHPLASFCWKSLIALYENDTPFTPRSVDLSQAEERAMLQKLWPVGKFPVLVDDGRNRTVPESSIIIEYLAQHYPGKSTLVPADLDMARQTRLQDRYYDNYLHHPMQRVVADRLRPKDKKDPYGVEQYHAEITSAYQVIEQEMAKKTWAMGDTFSMGDCAAAPALYWANEVQPIGSTYPKVATYLQRLKDRPSFARTLKEAEPFFSWFPRS